MQKTHSTLKNRLIGISILIMIAVLVLCYAATTPKYKIVKESISVSLGVNESKYTITPAEVEITSLWKYRPVTFKVLISGLESGTACVINPYAGPLEPGYAQLDTQEYAVAVSPTIITEDQYVTIMVRRLNFGAGHKQQQSFSFAETILTPSPGKLNVDRNYIFDLFVK